MYVVYGFKSFSFTNFTSVLNNMSHCSNKTEICLFFPVLRRDICALIEKIMFLKYTAINFAIAVIEVSTVTAIFSKPLKVCF